MSSGKNPNRVIWINTKQAPPLCDVPWYGTSVVLSDGDVQFCCHSPERVGNVSQASFQEIWNGEKMRNIRSALLEQRLPPECQSSGCPFYRGDKFNHLFGRIEGHFRYAITGTHDPHATIRDSLAESAIQIDGKSAVSITIAGDRWMPAADLFVALRSPENRFRFLPDNEPYASPYQCLRQKERAHRELIEFTLDDLTAGEHELCVALFAAGSNPNTLSNCYWSKSATIRV